MGALKIAVAALFLALVGPGVQAGAWKCQIGGKTVFSDVPCPGQGKVIDTTSGQTRGATGLRQDMLREQAREQAEARAALAAARVANVSANSPANGAGLSDLSEPLRRCPSDLQIKNWETTASSNHKSTMVSEALRNLEYARECRAGGAGARPKNCADLSDDFRRQRCREEEDRARRRQRAEDDRRREEDDRQRKQRDWESSTRCDRQGCWASDGRYNRVGPDTVAGPKGVCRVEAGKMKC